MGSESLVEFAMDHDGTTLVATVPNVFLPKPGRALWLSLRRDRCHVFASKPMAAYGGDMPKFPP